MYAISSWLLSSNEALLAPGLSPIWEGKHLDYKFKICAAVNSCWIVVCWPGGGHIAFRLAYAPAEQLEARVQCIDNEIWVNVECLMGKYQTRIIIPNDDRMVLRYETSITPSVPLLFPYWPRDIVPLGSLGGKLANGNVHLQQVGTRSGQLYFSLTQPKAGSVLYLQNLTALAKYNQDTETSAGDTVGGEWPEIGFALPPTLKNKPLEKGKKYIISDAVIVFDEVVPDDEQSITRQYLDLLSAAYLALPKPGTTYKHWPNVLDNGLKDLIHSPGCWSQVDGNHYFNAYVSDYATPPEIMVQLAVLLPLLDYVEWSNAELEVMKKIKEGLPAFFDEKYGTIMRWHPKAANKLEGEEEQKEPLTMDSWYLHHPLLNLSRLALKGDKVAEKLFLDSLEFAIKVAKHFDYQWPVFYKMDTLEIIKAETQPGNGGEKDVPGLYAHVMLQAWELTGKKKYLHEAEKAAQKLQGLGFDVFYQANNTAFSAGAMLRLFKATGKELYKELSYLCMASIFKNVKLWDCNYGYGKNFPSFFALFPLNDAPYTAVYEEQEVFCAFHDYLHHAEDVDILPSLRLLMAEYIRYLVDRAVYYYPTMLPKEMLSEEVKVGEVDHNLWVALEDLHDGWEQCGQVGQEVYGAGNAFGILPRHYMQVPGEDFMVYTDYPTYGFSAKKGAPIRFRLAGDNRINSRLMIVKTNRKKLPEFTISIEGQKESLKAKAVEKGNIELFIPGDAEISISW